MCKIIAIANQKGGVAKTTTTINLGVGLSKVGKRVMLIDADPQGHLTMGLGFPKNLMNQCETQSKSYEETKELCETLEKEMISLMSPDLRAMFEDYKEYTLNLKQTEQRDAYIDGLAFGIRTISEAFLHENKNRIW